MRLSVVFVGFMLVSVSTAQLAAILGAAKGAAALGASVAKLTSSILPAGLLLPFAAVGPLKLSLPFLLALKGLGLLKFKLLLAKAPLLAPIGIATAKFALLKAKYKVGKTALLAAGKAKMSLIELPVKLTAVKMGAIAGAVSGAKAGLASYKLHPKTSLIQPLLARTFMSERKFAIPQIPMKTITVQVRHDEVPAVVPEPEEPVPVYGVKRTTTTTTTTTTPRPAPAYTPEPPQPAYRKRREAESTSFTQYTPGALHLLFDYIKTYDTDRCVHRVVCEIAVDPEVGGAYGPDVTEFMMSLDESDPAAPWMSYKEASITGKTSGNRDACHDRFRECQRSSETVVKIAKRRLAGADF